ncbi:MAG: hypothetical protein WKF96_16420 [Solirubrobacteraceae bacterium]
MIATLEELTVARRATRDAPARGSSPSTSLSYYSRRTLRRERVAASGLADPSGSTGRTLV